MRLARAPGAPTYQSLQVRLPLLATALVCVVLAVFLWAAYGELRRSLLESARGRARHASEDLAALLAPGFSRRMADVRRLAAMPAVVACAAAADRPSAVEAEMVLRSEAGAGQQVLEIWTRDGTRRVSLTLPGNPSLAFPAGMRPTQPGVRLAQSGRGPIVADLIEPIVLGTSHGEIGFLVVRRVVSVSPPEILSRLVGSGADVRLGSSEGTWTDFTSITPGPTVDPSHVGPAEDVTRDGDRRIGAQARIADTPWLVWIGFPRGVVLGPAETFLYRAGVIALVFVIAGAVLSRVATRWITRPLAELTHSVEDLARGHERRRLPLSRPDEIGRLASSFNSMVDALTTARDRAIAQTRQAAFVADVAVALTEGGELREMLQRCAQAMVEHLDAAIASVWVTHVSEPVLELYAAAGPAVTDDGLPATVPLAAYTVGRVAVDRRPFATDQIDATQFASPALLQRAQVTSYAAFPLLIGDRSIGVVSMFGRLPLGQESLLALGSVARTLALGIERKRLDESRSRFEDMLESATDFVTIGRPTGPPLYINRAAREALGVAPDEVVSSLLEFRPAGFAEFFEGTVLSDAMRDGVWRGETVYRSRDGRDIPVSQVSVIHRDSTGAVQYISTISRDITDQQRAARERQTLEERLRATQKIEAIGQLAGGLAHDFNNLLTVVLGYAQLLDSQLASDDPSVRESLRQIQHAGDRAAELTRQLLAFSRRQRLQPASLDLNQRIDAVRPMLTSLLGEHIDLVATCAADLPAIRFDPAQLDLVLVNLAVNARDAMPHGGRFSLETECVNVDAEFNRTHVRVEPGTYVRLTVSDTGCGMDAATQQRAFDPFFTTKPPGKGTGLGLASVFGIVTQSGGSIWLYSEPGLGATFTLYLPIDRREAATVRPARACGLAPGNETILLVEDETSVRHLVEAVLTRAGYRVVSASHPSEALCIADDSAQALDLVITDVIMPEMNGAALVQQLRARRPALPVLFMSGFANDTVQHNGVAQAGMPFLQKPFTGAALALEVRRVLDDARCPSATMSAVAAAVNDRLRPIAAGPVSKADDPATGS